MMDLSFVSNQAKEIHALFSGFFYAIVLSLLLLGVLLEYFKWPLGVMPSFTTLIGRALIAAILLNAYPEISNTVAEISDAVASRLGDFNQFKLVLSNMSDKMTTLTWSWLSVKESVVMILSFVTFFLLYFSVFIVEAFLLYSWVLFYVLSLLMISLFVLPATAGATKALFRSLIEVCAWKVVWSVIATLLWSAAMSEINNPKYQINFVTAICFNLLLAASLLLTPFIVHAITGAGITGLVSTVGGITVGAATVSPSTIGKAGAKGLRSGMEKTEPMREAAMNRITNYRNEKKLESIRKRGDRPKT